MKERELSLDIKALPVHYFLSTYEQVKVNYPESPVLTKLNGGYLAFGDDAEEISKILRVPLYEQRVLHHREPARYCFIPSEGFEESLDAIMDVQGRGAVLADRTPDRGIETLAILPSQVQLSLF